MYMCNPVGISPPQTTRHSLPDPEVMQTPFTCNGTQHLITVAACGCCFLMRSVCSPNNASNSLAVSMMQKGCMKSLMHFRNRNPFGIILPRVWNKLYSCRTSLIRWLQQPQEPCSCSKGAAKDQEEGHNITSYVSLLTLQVNKQAWLLHLDQTKGRSTGNLDV